MQTIAKRNGVDSYPTLIFFNSKREDKFLYMGKTDAKSMYSKVDEELKLGLSQLVSVQAHDYTPLVFDNNADSVLLFLEQVINNTYTLLKSLDKILRMIWSFFTNYLHGEHGVVVSAFGLYWAGMRFKYLSTHHCWALSKSFMPSSVVWSMTKNLMAEKRKTKRATVRPLWPWATDFGTRASNRPLLDHLAANMVP